MKIILSCVVINLHQLHNSCYDEDIIIKVEWDGGDDKRGNSGRIISIGNNLGAKEEINLSIFIAAGGGDGEGGIGDVPEEELTDPPQDAVDAGPDGLGWHDEDGALTPGGTGSQSDQPVYFTGDPVIYEFQASGAGQRYFASPIMFFLDEPLSVDITNQNANLRLRVTFIVFKGDINFKKQGNKIGSITLNEDSADPYEPLESNTLTGGAINAMGLVDLVDEKAVDLKYGLIYIGGRIKIDHSEDISEKLVDSGPGFYLFPENTDLSQKDDLERLIEVENIGDINFGAMGILDLLIEEGIDFGGIDVGGMDGG